MFIYAATDNIHFRIVFIPSHVKGLNTYMLKIINTYFKIIVAMLQSILNTLWSAVRNSNRWEIYSMKFPYIDIRNSVIVIVNFPSVTGNLGLSTIIFTYWLFFERDITRIIFIVGMFDS